MPFLSPVGGDRLAGRRTCQQAVKRWHMLQLLDDLFNTGYGDMNVRHGGAHAAVAFVLDQTQRAGFGNGKVDAGQADFGGHEFFAQHGAADVDQFVDRFRVL